MLGIAATFGLARVVRASGGGGSIFDSTASAFVVPVIVIVVIGIVRRMVPLPPRAENRPGGVAANDLNRLKAAKNVAMS